MDSTKESADQSSVELNSGLVPANQLMPLADYLGELWRRRHFLVRVPLEDLRAQNAHTLLGGVWLLLSPILQVSVYFVIFGLLMKVNRGVDQYLVFLTVGVFTFLYAQRSVTEGARSVVTNIGLVRTVRLPLATLPISAAVGQAIAFGPALVVTLVVVLSHGNWPHVRWLLIPAAFILQTSFSLGAGFIAARFNHTYRDLESLLPFMFRLLFYASGVLFPLELYNPFDAQVDTMSASGDSHLSDEGWHAILLANPLYCFVALWRWVLVGTQASGGLWIACAIWSVASLAVGFTAFRAKEATYGSTQ